MMYPCVQLYVIIMTLYLHNKNLKHINFATQLHKTCKSSFFFGTIFLCEQVHVNVFCFWIAIV